MGVNRHFQASRTSQSSVRLFAFCHDVYRLNFRQQKFALSLTYFERALDVMQKKYGDDNPQLISVYQSLGRVSFITSVQPCRLRWMVVCKVFSLIIEQMQWFFLSYFNRFIPTFFWFWQKWVYRIVHGHTGLTHRFKNLWHSDTQALTPERQSFWMSKIKKIVS